MNVNEISVNGRKNRVEIILYSSPKCCYSKKTREFFRKFNVAFTDYNVSADYDKAKEMISLSGQAGVPVIIIDRDGKRDIQVGFDREVLLEAIFGN